VRETWRTVAFYAIVVALMIGALFVIDWVRG
jgi:preprotein translocase subunit SecE